MDQQNITPEQPAQADSGVPSVEDRLLNAFGMGDLTDEQPAQDEAPQGEEAAPEQPAEPSDDSAEVILEGKAYRVPKELKDAVLRHEDYTRKSQEVAERARAVDAQAKVLYEREQFQAAHAADLQALTAVQQQIREYSQMDMSTLTTDQLIKVKMHVDNLKEHERAKLAEVQGKAQEFQQRMHASLAELQQRGNEVLKKAIPTWGPETARDLAEYGRAQGYQDHELQQLYDPRHVQTLWKAAQWDKLQAGKPLANQRASTAAPVVKPGASNPAVNAQMEKARFAKAVKNAPDAKTKHSLIESKLMRMV